jgi:ABC-type transport system involved in multi-copper enzyme maturation permease subunit
MIARVLLVARNAFRAIMSKRAIYVWALAVVLMFMRSAPALFAVAPDAAVLQWIRANAVSATMDLWATLCIGAAILLGAGSVAGEINSKTIVTMLARPLRRWEVLLGKWLGVTAFAVVSLAIGVALNTAIAAYLGIDVDRRILAVALANTVVLIMLFGALAVVIGSSGSAVLGVAFSVLIIFIPPMLPAMMEAARPVYKAMGQTLDVLTPPGYDSHYAGMAWAPLVRRGRPGAPAGGPVFERPTIDYPAARRDMAENLAYGVVYFILGCVVFTRKDVKLS